MIEVSRLPRWPGQVFLVALAVACVHSVVFSQTKAATALRVIGDVPNQLALTLDQVTALPRQTVRVTNERGVPVTYEGVPLAEILRKAGAPLGDQLKGPNMAIGVVASAPDGYRVLFVLAEFDPAFCDRIILLADRRDGKLLDSHEGPLRIIAPGDKRGARWVRGVTTLAIVTTGKR